MTTEAVCPFLTSAEVELQGVRLLPALPIPRLGVQRLEKSLSTGFVTLEDTPWTAVGPEAQPALSWRSPVKPAVSGRPGSKVHNRARPHPLLPVFDLKFMPKAKEQHRKASRN